MTSDTAAAAGSRETYPDFGDGEPSPEEGDSFTISDSSGGSSPSAGLDRTERGDLIVEMDF